MPARRERKRQWLRTKDTGTQDTERQFDGSNHPAVIVHLGTEAIRTEWQPGKVFLQIGKSLDPLAGQPLEAVTHMKRKIIVNGIGKRDAYIVESGGYLIISRNRELQPLARLLVECRKAGDP